MCGSLQRTALLLLAFDTTVVAAGAQTAFILTASPTSGRDGDVVTLSCSHRDRAPLESVKWSMNNVHVFSTNIKTSIIDVDRNSALFHKITGRFNVSLYLAIHQLNLKINSSLDDGSIWGCSGFNLIPSGNMLKFVVNDATGVVSIQNISVSTISSILPAQRPTTAAVTASSSSTTATAAGVIINDAGTNTNGVGTHPSSDAVVTATTPPATTSLGRHHTPGGPTGRTETSLSQSTTAVASIQNDSVSSTSSILSTQQPTTTSPSSTTTAAEVTINVSDAGANCIPGYLLAVVAVATLILTLIIYSVLLRMRGTKFKFPFTDCFVVKNDHLYDIPDRESVGEPDSSYCVIQNTGPIYINSPAGSSPDRAHNTP